MAYRDLTAHYFQLRNFLSRPPSQYDDDDLEPDEFYGYNNPIIVKPITVNQQQQHSNEDPQKLAKQSQWIQNVHIIREDLSALAKKSTCNFLQHIPCSIV